MNEYLIVTTDLKKTVENLESDKHCLNVMKGIYKSIASMDDGTVFVAMQLTGNMLDRLAGRRYEGILWQYGAQREISNEDFNLIQTRVRPK